jgi:hypothetical protein
MTGVMWTVHIAGDVDGAVQPCLDCGLVLRDNTAWSEGRVPVQMPWWNHGERVGTDGNALVRGLCWFAIPDDRELQPDEQACTPAEVVSDAAP